MNADNRWAVGFGAVLAVGYMALAVIGHAVIMMGEGASTEDVRLQIWTARSLLAAGAVVPALVIGIGAGGSRSTVIRRTLIVFALCAGLPLAIVVLAPLLS